LGQAALQAQGAGNEALSQLGMRGGYYSGARQRIAEQGMNQAQALQQGVRSQGEQSRLGLLAGGEAQKTDLQKYMADVANQRATSDVGAARADQIARNAFLADLFKSQMEGWAAGEEARGMERSGGSK
jgi:hypothetical protein